MDSERTSRQMMKKQIIMAMLKLKHKISFEMLAYISDSSKTTVIEYVWKWLDIMYIKLKFLMQNRDTKPAVSEVKYPRFTIIDNFEVFVESPSSLIAIAQLYSQYKKHCTDKVLIPCKLFGVINFISQCWGERTSNIQITRESKYPTNYYHRPGNQILEDREFTLQDDFAAGNCSELLIPAFTRGKKQFLAKELENSIKIASVRIHILKGNWFDEKSVWYPKRCTSVENYKKYQI